MRRFASPMAHAPEIDQPVNPLTHFDGAEQAPDSVDKFIARQSSTVFPFGTSIQRKDKLLSDSSVDFFTKMECENPTGSNKYRAANYMIEKALEAGEIKRGSTVIETSSGNMSAALALVCKIHGLRFIAVIDPLINSKDLEFMSRQGANIDLIDPPEDGNFAGARLKRIRVLVGQNPDYYWTRQHINPDHTLSHFFNTGAEIHRNFGDSLDVICVADQTAATARGLKSYFNVFSPSTKVVAVDVDTSRLFKNSGEASVLPGIGCTIQGERTINSDPDYVFHVTEQECVMGCYNAMYKDNALLSPSGGAIIKAIDNNIDFFKGKRVLGLVMDRADKYQDTIYNAQWLEKNLNLSQVDVSVNMG